MRGIRTRILKKYNRRRSKRYSKKSKRHTRKNVYSKTYKKIQKGGFLCDKEKTELERCKQQLEECNLKNKSFVDTIDSLTKQLTASEKELSTYRSTLEGLSKRNTELLAKSKDDVKSSPAYLDMAKNVKSYEENNKNLTGEVEKLKYKNFQLSMQLTKLTNQKMPTEKEIDAVSLDDNDNEVIDKMLDEWYSNYTKIAGNSKGEMPEHDTPIINIEEYKSQNRERAIREYKKIKLMKEHSGS